MLSGWGRISVAVRKRSYAATRPRAHKRLQHLFRPVVFCALCGDTQANRLYP